MRFGCYALIHGPRLGEAATIDLRELPAWPNGCSANAEESMSRAAHEVPQGVI